MIIFRRWVSQDKIRFTNESYDLDLAYITDRIIAMGFPSTGFSSSYRNPQSDVFEFLEEFHPNHYKILNLSEESYHSSLFNGNVEHLPFPDHHSPPFDLLLIILKIIHDWLILDPQNIIAIHCIAGMGRTGTVISSLLVYEGIEADADYSLLRFANFRTGSDKAITNPSQLRYVRYACDFYRNCINNNLNPYISLDKVKRTLKKITFSNLYFDRSIFCYILILDSNNDIIYNSSWLEKPQEVLSSLIEFYPNKKVIGDFTINLIEIKKSFLSTITKEILYFSLNTNFFIEDVLIIKKKLIDGPHKDINDSIFPNDFNIKLEFKSLVINSIKILDY